MINLNQNEMNTFGYLLITLSIVAFTFFIKWKNRRKELIRKASKIPVPSHMSCYPIIGHAHHFFKHTDKMVDTLIQFCSESVYPRTAYLGPIVCHAIVRPEDMEIILNSKKALSKFDFYRFTIPIAGAGLFNLDVETWRRHRKIIAPTLNSKIIDEFVVVFGEQVNIMKSLLKAADKKELDTFRMIFKCTLDCVFETIMSIHINCQTTGINGVEENIIRGTEITMIRAFNLFLNYDFIFNLTALAREEKRIVANFKSFVDKIVIEKIDAFNKENQLSEEEQEAEINESKKRKAFLDHLITLSVKDNKLTRSEITNEVQTFIIASADTTATLTALALMCIALFPEIQKKVYEEIIEVLGKDKQIDCSSDLSRLKYTEMVLKETMRLFPLGPFMLRNIDEDLELETCTLAKGSSVLLSVINLHRHPNYYKDPLKFIPERFSPEEIEKRHPYSFLAFSAGPRNCIGLKYGMMLAKCLFASIVRECLITTDYKSIEEVQLKQEIVVKPVFGYKLHLTHRKDDIID